MAETVYDGISDQDLIREVNRGDDSAFEELHFRYRQHVYSKCLARLGREQEAEDVVQEVFTALYRSAGEYTETEDFIQWLDKLMNQVLSREGRKLRAQRAHDVQEDAAPHKKERVSGIKEYQLMPHLEFMSSAEIKQHLNADVVKSEYEFLVRNSIAAPKLIRILEELFKAAETETAATSWAQLWESVKLRRPDVDEVSSAWREAARVALSGELSFEVRSGLWNAMERLTLIADEGFLSRQDEVIPKDDEPTETASEFLSFLNELIKEKPHTNLEAGESVDNEFLRQQFIDLSKQTGRQPSTIMLSASSFVDEVLNNKTPLKESLKIMLVLALITPKERRRSLINIIETYLNQS